MASTDQWIGLTPDNRDRPLLRKAAVHKYLVTDKEYVESPSVRDPARGGSALTRMERRIPWQQDDQERCAPTMAGTRSGSGATSAAARQSEILHPLCSRPRRCRHAGRKGAAAYGDGACARRKGRSLCTVRKARGGCRRRLPHCCAPIQSECSSTGGCGAFHRCVWL